MIVFHFGQQIYILTTGQALPTSQGDRSQNQGTEESPELVLSYWTARRYGDDFHTGYASGHRRGRAALTLPASANVDRIRLTARGSTPGTYYIRGLCGQHQRRERYDPASCSA